VNLDGRSLNKLMDFDEYRIRGKLLWARYETAKTYYESAK